MHRTERQSKSSFWTYAGLMLSLVVGFIIGYATSGLSTYLSSVTPEYHSAGTIYEVTEFVREHDRWPTSWSELNSPPLEGVLVDWALDIESCDRHDVMTAIVPTTRRYQTYPYAEQQLDALWQAVQESRDALHENPSSPAPQPTDDARE